MKVVESESPAKFPHGQYKEGDTVRLRRPGSSAGAFHNPRAPLVVARVLYYRSFSPPTYALVEEDGGLAVVPFNDADLRRARPSRAKKAQSELHLR